MARAYKGPGEQAPRAPAVLHREGEYITLTDYDTAVYLFACNLPFVSARPVTENQREFVFQDKKGEAESKVLELVNRCSPLQPLDILDAQRWLRKLLHRRFPTSVERERRHRARYPTR